MLVRSSLKRLATTLCYPMSGKKTTEQWRKPIQQLKKQKQQATPIPADADQKKKAAMQFYEREYFSKHKQRPEDFAPKEKKLFRKKGQNQQQAESQQESKPKTPEVNWLEMTQIKQTSQLTELVNEALNMSRLKYLPELKDVLSQVRTKFGQDEIEYLLNTLFKQNFMKTYDNLKELGVDITKMSPKLVNTVLFNFVHMQEYGKLQALLNELKSVKFTIQPKQQQFFEFLFFKQTSQQVPFEYGQNSINISLHNSNFIKKLQIANTYNYLVSKSDRKKARRGTVLPLWLSQASKIVLQYRFGRKQFKKLLTNIITHQQHLLPQNFLQTPQFSKLMYQFYFGSQQGLKLILGCIQRLFNKSVKFSTFYQHFTHYLMLYRTSTQKPAFEVDQQLISFYKRGFQHHKKYLSITCAIIAADARYVDLAQHYVRHYVQMFPSETLSSEETRFVEEGLVNNYQYYCSNGQGGSGGESEKLLVRMTKQGQNFMTRLKAAIKLNNLTLAYNLFQQQVYKKTVIQRQRKNIQFVLRNQLTQKSSVNYLNIKDINGFIQKLDDYYLWNLYKRSQDLSVMLKKYIPEDKFSFWQQQQKKQLFEEISAKYSRGHLQKVKQPQSDVEGTGFSLDEYLETEFPQLRQLQTKEYEKQKQLIKYTLRVQGLIEFQKVHSDDTVIQKLTDFLAQLSQQSLQVLQNFGLRNYDIKQWGWDQYVIRFNKMKQQSNIVKDERVDWSGYSQFVENNKALSKKNIIEEMMIKTPELFKEAEALVKLNEEPMVNKLLLWGVYTNQPMAVYLGQKLAMQTGQVIPHQLALLVSRMLSYKRPLSQQFIHKCKQCLKIIGKIDRQFIYLFNHDYQHILQRKNFLDYVIDKIEDKRHDNRELEDLITVTPRQFLERTETRLYRESIVSRVL